MRVSNDNATLVPRTDFDGPALELDFPGLRIGVAEYEEGPTGCTVFHFVGGATCTTDVRGGSPGTTGVAAELFAAREYAVGWLDIATVSGAIIFDYARPNSIYPDKELGRAAFRAAREGWFPLGARGAGRSATVGKTFGLGELEPGGQGGAFRQLGPTRVAVFTVVNAVGAVLDRNGQVVRGHLDAATGARRALVEGVEKRVASGRPVHELPGNTTLTVVVTNQTLDRRVLQQLGRQVHASLARAIQPFHALVDGDVLYAVSTGEV